MNPQRLFPVDFEWSSSRFCLRVRHYEASVQQTRNKREEQLYSARAGCNPSARIMNCVCVGEFAGDGGGGVCLRSD